MNKSLICALIVCVFYLGIIINALDKRAESTRQWVQNLQACMYVASVQAPCEKCGNTVFNTSQFWDDGPAVHRTRCAKCGEPDPESRHVTHEWWASNSWKWEKK